MFVYQEMLKYTKDDRMCQQQLEESLNTMLEVVRIVNNSMYEVCIVGFPVSIFILVLSLLLHLGNRSFSLVCFPNRNFECVICLLSSASSLPFVTFILCQQIIWSGVHNYCFLSVCLSQNFD